MALGWVATAAAAAASRQESRAEAPPSVRPAGCVLVACRMESPAPAADSLTTTKAPPARGVGIHTKMRRPQALAGGAEAGIPRSAAPGGREPAAAGNLPALPPGQAADWQKRRDGRERESERHRDKISLVLVARWVLELLVSNLLDSFQTARSRAPT